MITAIVFSKDRACQLHLLLESIKKNCHDLFDLQVIYSFSTRKFLDGYEKLLDEGENLPKFTSIPQADDDSEIFSFNKLCKHLVKTSNSLLTFITDDAIVYRPIDITEQEIQEVLDSVPTVSNVCLRLGKNTYYQYLSSDGNHVCPFPQECCKRGKFLIWNVRSVPPHTNYGYPLATDLHIFRRSFMELIIDQENFNFNNPNSFEGDMQQFMELTPPLMACCDVNYLVNNPINRVQDTCLNRAGDEYGITPEELNNRYLDGEVIDLESIDFSNIIGCEQELDMSFIKRTN